MSTAFSFFLRLFLCFVGARFLLQSIDVEGRGYLVGLTILLLLNVYWFSYLLFQDRPGPIAADNIQPQPSIHPEPDTATSQENKVRRTSKNQSGRA